jgi:flagellar biosynthesis protein FlhA
VVDASTVVATHLNHLIHAHAAELLGRQEVQQLLDRIGKESPMLVQDLVPKTLSLTTLQKVLQNLLDESVPIRDMRTILDVLAENARHGERHHRADLADTAGAVARHRAAHLPGQRGAAGHRPGQLAGPHAAAGAEQQRRPGAGPGRQPAARSQAGHGPPVATSGLAPVLVVQHPLRVLLARFLRRSLPAPQGAVARRNTLTPAPSK